MLTWCTMPVPGGTTLNSLNASWPQRRNWYRSRLRSYSSSTFRSNASGRPNTSATTEWSMTSSAGISGLIFVGSPPRACMASRMAARSTTAGHAGEVLQDHPGRGELDLGVRLGARVPVGERVDLLGGDVGAVLVAEQVLQQDLQAERQAVRSVRQRPAGRSRTARPRPEAPPGCRSCSPSSLPEPPCSIPCCPSPRSNLQYLDIKVPGEALARFGPHVQGLPLVRMRAGTGPNGTRRGRQRHAIRDEDTARASDVGRDPRRMDRG